MEVSLISSPKVDHLMHKSRIDPSGKLLEKSSRGLGDGNQKMNAARNKTTAKDYCGSCYGSRPDKSACCNTCEDVRSSYRV